jgi:hypothetical protein
MDRARFDFDLDFAFSIPLAPTDIS